MTRQDKYLDGKVAVVTGAGRGIGRAIAVAYARAGAAVCCAARTAAEIQSTIIEIGRRRGQALAVPTDVTQLDSVRRMFKTASTRLGGIDIVVINAGVSTDPKPVGDSNPEDWRKTIEVNLVGAYYCAKMAIPHLRERGAGKIIIIGSGLGHRGRPGRSAYACSKAGVWMLTRILAQELEQYRISVNELIPGPVETSLTSGTTDERGPTLGWKGEWLKRPEAVVPLALFLATQPDPGPTAQSFSLMRRDS